MWEPNTKKEKEKLSSASLHFLPGGTPIYYGGGGVVIFQTVFPKPQPDRIFCFNPSAWACPMQGPKGSLGLPRTLWGLGRDGAHHS